MKPQPNIPQSLPNQRLARISAFLHRHHRFASFLLVFSGILLTLPGSCFFSTQGIGSNFGLLDASWQLEMPMRLRWGDWSGRDFLFTYGPLYQLTHALGFVLGDGSAASMARFHGVLETSLLMVLAWAALATTGAPWRWRALSYSICTVVYAHFSYLSLGLKPLGATFLVTCCAAAFGKSINTDSESKNRVLVWSALLVPVALLYSFDAGTYSFLALLLVGAATLASTWKNGSETAKRVRRRSARFLSVIVGSSTAFFLVCLSLPAWRNYLTDSWELSQAYTLVFATPLSEEYLPVLLGVVFGSLSVIVYCMAQIHRSLKEDTGFKANVIAMLGLATFTLVAARAGLTRSDGAHILYVAAPFFFLAVPYALCLKAPKNIWFAVLAVSFLLPVILWTCTQPQFIMSQRMYLLCHPDFRPAHFKIFNKAILNSVELVKQTDSRYLAVWPVQTIVNVVTGKRNPVYTMQSYAAGTPRLENVTVSRMSRIADLPVLFIHKRWATDNVEDLTRNPSIFLYFLQNYQATESVNDFAVLLKRRTQKQRDRWRAVALPVLETTFRPRSQASAVLSLPQQTSSGENVLHASDLLLLRMSCAKTNLFSIRKPGQFTIEFVLSNGRREKQIFLLAPDGKSHDVLISPTRSGEAGFLHLFAPQPTFSSPVRIYKIIIEWQPLDFLSATPDWVSVTRVSKLRWTAENH